jgi:hypothetical protein
MIAFIFQFAPALFPRGGSSPLKTLIALCAVVLVPWAWQAYQNRHSTMGASRMDEIEERRWRRVALIFIPLLIAAAVAAKALGLFTSWHRW